MAPPEVVRLVERFRAQRDSYRSGGYNETQLRREFADPLFEALGWDITNRRGLASAYKEVVHEDRLIVGGASRAPDYAFRIGGERKFFVETKKPAVNLRDAPSPAFQLRRYAWSAKLPLSILTDFEEFVVYDCRVEPAKEDGAATARLLYVKSDEFADRWDEIASLFSREAVLRGSLEEFAETLHVRRGTSEVDGAFLRDIERWRTALAEDIASRNPNVTQRELNFAVQQTIDRIVFLRIAEDRGLEPYGQLRDLADGEGVYPRLKRLFVRADDRYNAGLFHFQDEPDRQEGPDMLTPGLEMGDGPFREIFARLYYPDSPYEFSVLPAQTLGQVYEQFLGQVIRLTEDHQAVVEDKPEVKKAGGVYYTPTPIVDFIVRATLGRLVEGRTIRQVGGAGRRPPIRVLDAACGSGTFLLGAYDFLLAWYLQAYISDGPEKWVRGRSPRIRRVSQDIWRLTVDERKRILLTHIYGVDIDAQAVEVTKLSLLLKVLEGESQESVFPQMELLQQRVLPDLARNIKCGNSLVGHDLYEQIGLLDQERRHGINTFDWKSEFGQVFESSGGFDAVIGNPPYIDSELMTQVMPECRAYCTKRYPAASGNWDIFCVFIEKALELCSPGGSHSFIVPNKLASADYAGGARNVVSQVNNLTVLRDYSSVGVFPVAVYPIIYVADKSPRDEDAPVALERMSESPQKAVQVAHHQDLDKRRFFRGSHPWPIFSGLEKASPLERLRDNFPRLSEVAQVWGAATVAEAYEIAPLIAEGRDPLDDGDLMFINSGTVDRYVSLWGAKRLRYLKRAFERPVIPGPSVAALPATRARQARTPKLVIAGMTKVLECAPDLKGCVLAGKSTSIVVSDLDLRFLLGILNSSVVDFFYSAEYGGNRLQGGYLRVGPPQLRNIPVPLPDGDAAEAVKAFVALVDGMLDVQAEFLGASTPAERTACARLVEAKDAEINSAAYSLYGLTSSEISVVERSTKDEQS